MEQINKKDIVIPDWSFKNIDTDTFKSLSNSIRKNGQTKNIIVRALGNSKYEIIDGRIVFSILKQLDKDYIYCHVFKNVTELEAKLLYLQHDFYFENNFVEVAKVLKTINSKISKLEISRNTKYNFNEVGELLNLATFDFKRFQEEKVYQNMKLF